MLKLGNKIIPSILIFTRHQNKLNLWPFVFSSLALIADVLYCLDKGRDVKKNLKKVRLPSWMGVYIQKDTTEIIVQAFGDIGHFTKILYSSIFHHCNAFRF